MTRYYCIIDKDKNIIDFGKSDIDNINYHRINYNDFKLLSQGARCFLDENGEVRTNDKTKKILLKELDNIFLELKEQGIKYSNKWFKCDDEAKDNLSDTILMLDLLLSQGTIKWYTRNGEEGYVEFNTKEEFMSFATVLAAKIAELKNKYYEIKNLILNITDQDELNTIDVNQLFNMEARNDN